MSRASAWMGGWLVVCGLALGIAGPACHSVGSAGAARARLRPLDAEVAAHLRQAFDEAVDVPRFVVALSPT